MAFAYTDHTLIKIPVPCEAVSVSGAVVVTVATIVGTGVGTVVAGVGTGSGVVAKPAASIPTNSTVTVRISYHRIS